MASWAPTVCWLALLSAVSVTALCPHIRSSDDACAVEADEASFVQLSGVVKYRKGRSAGPVLSGPAKTSRQVGTAQKKHVGPTAPSGSPGKVAASGKVADNIMQSIAHCFEKRGLDLKNWKKPPIQVYMHAGTAVHYEKCRAELNDIDLWMPGVKQILPMIQKKKLLDAYGEGTGIHWDFSHNPDSIPGLTDKGTEELPDQIYCPEEVVDGVTFKEVDCFGGIDGKFDTVKFAGIASGAIANAKFVQRGLGIDLYTIGVCNLVQFKVALITGGRSDPKPTDIQDLDCLCKKGGPADKLRDQLCDFQCARFFVFKDRMASGSKGLTAVAGR